ncbi:hypothetical protein G3570_00850 [Balneolaceae bacterium YR4-1]|uniref:DUF4270 family protein n=1 Tax=Halalkalibaculum roseum TaxID=2709311 RepID=A0A6M1T470_9BACT|nr:hypothetical protein [Halalkalibaculum roseum]NGP75163.1 hypothetical protein [Halalkalibaculum roseum]
MSVARNNAAAFCLFFLVSVSGLILSACESPGSVGGSFTDPGTELKDTAFAVTGVETESYTTYSGRLNFFSAGQFNDPLFGNLNAQSYIKPSLPGLTSDTLRSDLQMNLRLILDDNSLYGDTLSTADFDLVEIDQIWRGRAVELYDDIDLSQNLVGSFSVDEATDSVDVPLASEWVQRYRAYYNTIGANRDSLYLYDFHGLALVPRNESKIIPFNPSRIRFVTIENGSDTSSSITPSQWAYTLDRSNATDAPTGSSKAISTFEEVLKFDLDLSREDLGTVNISRVELVFYQNNQALQSSISGSARRPAVNSAGLYFSRPEDIPASLSTASALSRAFYNETDGSYRFDITGFTNGVLLDGTDDERSFYLTLQSNNGILGSSLLYNEDGPEDKRPKIIVTYINTKDN